MKTKNKTLQALKKEENKKELKNWKRKLKFFKRKKKNQLLKSLKNFRDRLMKLKININVKKLF
jgi:hypothetical protein